MELKTEHKSDKIAYLYAGIAVFVWASAFPAVKYSLNYYSPETLMLFRFLIASATLVPISVIKKSRLPAKEDIPIAAAGGVIGIFLYMWLFNTGTGMLKTGVSSFIIATSPIFTMLFSIIFLKEKARVETIAGVAVSAVGLLIITIAQVREFSLNGGILILLLGSIATSCYNIIQRKISFKYTPIECTTYSIVCGTAFMLIFLPGLIEDFKKAPLFADFIVVYMGVFPAALAYLSWNYALGKAEKVTNATNFLYLVPFFATTLSFIFLHEVLSPLSFAGGIIIISGMMLSNWKPKKADALI